MYGYDEWAAHMTEDIPFYVDLARENDGPVVELAVGTGRVAKTASLRPGGRFAWNVFAFDHRVAVRLDGVRQAEPRPHTTRYAVGDNRVDIVREDGTTSTLWWGSKNEWLGLIDVAGLALEALYGGFGREPYTPDSTEYVFIARKESA